LTAPEVIRIGKHLLNCQACSIGLRPA
jgi:hypothetical protein